MPTVKQILSLLWRWKSKPAVAPPRQSMRSSVCFGKQTHPRNDMAVQIRLSAIDRAKVADRRDGAWSVAPDLCYLRLAIVNVAGDRQWALIDTGLPTCRGSIIDVAEKRFGSSARPAAIVLTHGISIMSALCSTWHGCGTHPSTRILF